MKFRKHAHDSTNENRLDRISALPDDLLAKIVSFLPIGHAVRTSILSTRWRYIFTLIPCLSFDDRLHLNPYKVGNERVRFMEFVDKVLELHQASGIQKFSIICTLGYDYLDLNRWINTALRKGVRELDIVSQFYAIARAPVCVFTCETLISLRLMCRYFGAKEVEIPLSTRLPKLKILHLSDIKFLDMTSVQRLFSSCGRLEELSLRDCTCKSKTSGHAIYRTATLKVLTVRQCFFSSGVFEIDAPNLAYLRYSRNVDLKIVPSWSNSSTFVSAELDLRRIGYDGNERQLLKAAAYKTTSLGTKSMEAFRTFGEPMLEFHYLSRLEVKDCPYDAWKYMISLISKAPQLKTIKFNSGFHCCLCPEPLRGDKCPGECYCNSLPFSEMSLLPFSCQVEVIQVGGFCEHKGPWTLMCHLLENASLLSRLTIYLRSHYDDDDDVDRIRDQLMMLPRASTDCRIDVDF